MVSGSVACENEAESIVETFLKLCIASNQWLLPHSIPKISSAATISVVVFKEKEKEKEEKKKKKKEKSTSTFLRISGLPWHLKCAKISFSPLFPCIHICFINFGIVAHY